MKALNFLLLILSLTDISGFAQNTWTVNNSFGGAARAGAVGFFIQPANRGYIGTGAFGTNGEVDFWEFDPVYNVWTQKANFSGTGRAFAVGFAIGNKGYIGTGTASSGSTLSDFWEYNPDSNVWRQRADFIGGARSKAVGFSIGNKGYIGTGESGASAYNDFYEYNPDSDLWTRKADFGGYKRYGALGFSIGTNGYLGAGDYDNNFWEYNSITNVWTKKSNYIMAYTGSVAFSVGGKGYAGTGHAYWVGPGGGGYGNSFYEYNPITDTWTRQADYFTPMAYGVGFSSCTKGYIGTGMFTYSATTVYYNNFAEYAPPKKMYPAFSASLTKFCKGECINFTDTSSFNLTNWQWTFPKANPGTSTIKNPTHICFDTSGIFGVTLSTHSGNCTLTSSPMTITVNSSIVANAGADATICSGDSVKLKATGGSFYLWKPITGLSDPTIPNPIAFPKDTTVYSVTVSSGTCPPITDLIKINVNPKPKAPWISLNLATLSSNYAWGNQWYDGPYTISGAIYQAYTVTRASLFSVKYTDYNGCSSISDPYRIFRVGINETENLSAHFNISPNPSTGKITIQSKMGIQDFSIEIFNQLGEKCYSEKIFQDRNDINLSNHPAGVYFIRILEGEKVYQTKLILEN